MLSRNASCTYFNGYKDGKNVTRVPCYEDQNYFKDAREKTLEHEVLLERLNNGLIVTIMFSCG